MTLETAPYHAEVAHGPASGTACWATASDGVRIRIGLWPCKNSRGTVLIFPGRTEFVEKYGMTATALAKRGLASVVVDWRGQGLSDRLLPNEQVGHVERFSDYQKDIVVMLEKAQMAQMKAPFYLLAHSMGGAIGLRALMEGLDVKAVTFSGPMWGIEMSAHLRPMAWALSHAMPVIGQGHRLPPNTRLEHHILADGFEDNLLTTDRKQFDIMRQQILVHSELSLGGPSYVWLREALLETRRLARRPSPDLPCLTYFGSNERIVDIPAIHNRMAAWKDSRLEIVPGAEHEVLMEDKSTTAPMFDDIASFFTGAAEL